MNFLRALIIYVGHITGIVLPFLLFQYNKSKNNRLTIYNLHSTSIEDFPKYFSLLKRIDQKEKFINPKELDKFFNNKLDNKSFSLLTLDDGFDNNYIFAKTVLKELNIKAIFFIIPNIINNKSMDTNYEFYNILFPKKNIKKFKKYKNKFKPMSLKKILNINNYGHTIGMHGYNHENFGTLNEQEILSSINKGLNIFKKYKIEVKHFAYPFGHKNSFNKISNNLVKQYFKYIHLGIRGINYNKKTESKGILLMRHPISSLKKDLKYSPISYKEINFFTSNRISFLINKFYKS